MFREMALEDIRDKTRKEILEKQFELLQSRSRLITHLKSVLLFCGLACLVAASILLILGVKNTLIVCLLFAYGLLILIASYLLPSREIETEMRDVDNELEYLTISETSPQQRAEKKLRLDQIELKEYYDQTLRQSTWIFFVGLVCIFLGFAIIGGAIYAIADSSRLTLKPETQVIVAIIGGIGGFLSNFIAAIYLKMYSMTVGSLTEFHNRLVLTHNLHFANFIAAKITDEALLEKTYAEFALNITKIIK